MGPWKEDGRLPCTSTGAALGKKRKEGGEGEGEERMAEKEGDTAPSRESVFTEPFTE